jgi:hypothetical protein
MLHQAMVSLNPNSYNQPYITLFIMQKAKTRMQQANEYGVSYRTFLRWLKREKLDLPKGLITPNFQKKIYDKFGNPNE